MTTATKIIRLCEDDYSKDSKLDFISTAYQYGKEKLNKKDLEDTMSGLSLFPGVIGKVFNDLKKGNKQLFDKWARRQGGI